MTAKRPLVTVVDDDESVRESLPDLLKELGFDTQAFSSAEAFLGAGQVERSQCLILDIAMPGMTGPELQLELVRRGSKIPIVFITAQCDETTRSMVVQRGAVTCLSKPFTEVALLEALDTALGAKR